MTDELSTGDILCGASAKLNAKMGHKSSHVNCTFKAIIIDTDFSVDVIKLQEHVYRFIKQFAKEYTELRWDKDSLAPIAYEIALLVDLVAFSEIPDLFAGVLVKLADSMDANKYAVFEKCLETVGMYVNRAMNDDAMLRTFMDSARRQYERNLQCCYDTVCIAANKHLEKLLEEIHALLDRAFENRSQKPEAICEAPFTDSWRPTQKDAAPQIGTPRTDEMKDAAGERHNKNKDAKLGKEVGKDDGQEDGKEGETHKDDEEQPQGCGDFATACVTPRQIWGKGCINSEDLS